MRMMGIDFGLRKVGVATGDTETGMAFPLQTVKYRNFAELFEELEKITVVEDIALVVVGTPKAMSGKSTEQTELTSEFIKDFKENSGLAVETIDERLTTGQAKKLGGDDDKIAAQIILQTYLDRAKKEPK